MKKDSRGFYQTIAWLLPKKLIYFCLIRGWANATTGKYEDTDATKITVAMMVKRWDEKDQ